MRDVFKEYIAGDEDLRGFLGHSPENVIDAAHDDVRWDPDFAKKLSEYQIELGGTASIQGKEPVVITGQQPGLFTGPLYTIYKAVTTIALANKLSEDNGVKHVPVFWMGSEDHDFEEAKTATLLSRKHEPLSLSYSPEGDIEGLSLYRVPLEDSLRKLIDEAASSVPGSEFTDEIKTFLHESLDKSGSFSEWTERILARLFVGTGLVIFSPHLPVARKLAAPVIEREIRNPLKATALLNEAGEQLKALGFKQQLTKAPNECCFFLEVGEGALQRRRKVTYEHNKFFLPEEDQEYSADQMLEMLHETPERFSQNVALRCIVQQKLFPAVAYVAGPGEISYWAQFKALFEFFELPMPVVYPRARCTLTTLKLNKLRKKLGVDLSQLTKSHDELIDIVLQSLDGNPACDVVKGRRGDIERAMNDLEKDLAAKDKTAADMMSAVRRRMDSEFDRIEHRILHSDTERTETLSKQLERLCNSLAPFRLPQERVYNVLSYLFEHGWGLVPRLISELDIESFEMNEVEL